MEIKNEITVKLPEMKKEPLDLLSDEINNKELMSESENTVSIIKKEPMDCDDQETKLADVEPLLQFKKEPVDHFDYDIPVEVMETELDPSEVVGMHELEELSRSPSERSQSVSVYDSDTIGIEDREVDESSDHIYVAKLNCEAKDGVLKLSENEMLRCFNCNFENRFEGNLEVHIAKRKLLRLKCSKCGFQTKWKVSLGTLDDGKKQSNEVLKCPQCNFQTTWKRNIKIHMKKHSDELLKCSECGFQTIWERNLIRHMKKHSDEMLKCSECSFETKWKGNLVSHMKMHSDETLKCAKCGFETKWKKSFKNHIGQHSEEILQCAHCSFHTFWERKFKEHMKKHYVGLLKCTECGFQTRWRRSLKDHMAKHSTDGELHNCSECSFQTKLKRNLKAHIKRHNCKFIKCPDCSFQTKCERSLRRHMDRHTNEMLPRFHHQDRKYSVD